MARSGEHGGAPSHHHAVRPPGGLGDGCHPSSHRLRLGAVPAGMCGKTPLGKAGHRCVGAKMVVSLFSRPLTESALRWPFSVPAFTDCLGLSGDILHFKCDLDAC